MVGRCGHVETRYMVLTNGHLHNHFSSRVTSTVTAVFSALACRRIFGFDMLRFVGQSSDIKVHRIIGPRESHWSLVGWRKRAIWDDLGRFEDGLGQVFVT